MTEVIIPAACAVWSTVAALVGYELGLRRQRIESRMAEDMVDRIDRLDSASQHQLAWSKLAEEEFDRLHARIEGVPADGPYRDRTFERQLEKVIGGRRTTSVPPGSK